MIRLWRYLKAYWYAPVVILGIWLGWAVFRRSRDRGTPVRQTVLELAAMAAGKRIRELEIERDTDTARQHVIEAYHQEINALSESQQARARELKDDPAKLAAYLVRAAGGRV